MAYVTIVHEGREWVDKESFDERAPALRWTTDKPSKPWWYWWKDVDRPGTPFIVQVLSDGYGLVVYGLEEYSRRLYETHGQWAGPLDPPA